MDKACVNKSCNDFGIMKPVDGKNGFHVNKQNSDGYHSYCKKCRNKKRGENHSKKVIKKMIKEKEKQKAGRDLLEMVKESKK